MARNFDDTYSTGGAASSALKMLESLIGVDNHIVHFLPNVVAIIHDGSLSSVLVFE